MATFIRCTFCNQYHQDVLDPLRKCLNSSGNFIFIPLYGWISINNERAKDYLQKTEPKQVRTVCKICKMVHGRLEACITAKNNIPLTSGGYGGGLSSTGSTSMVKTIGTSNSSSVDNIEIVKGGFSFAEDERAFPPPTPATEDVVKSILEKIERIKKTCQAEII